MTSFSCIVPPWLEDILDRLSFSLLLLRMEESCAGLSSFSISSPCTLPFYSRGGKAVHRLGK